MTVVYKFCYAYALLRSVGIYHILHQICAASEARVIEAEINGEFWIVNPVIFWQNLCENTWFGFTKKYLYTFSVHWMQFWNLRIFLLFRFFVKLILAKFRVLKSTLLTISEAGTLKIEYLETPHSQKLISRKIWVTSKLPNFHTVTSKSCWWKYFLNDDNSATVLKSTFQGSHDRWFQKSPAVAALVLSSLQ